MAVSSRYLAFILILNFEISIYEINDMQTIGRRLRKGISCKQF